MSDRGDLATHFLAQTDWAGATRSHLAGDASNRRYERLTDPETGATAVLMDAPPEKGEDIRPFLRIARHLSGLGLSAPQIYASDADTGFALIEDFGDALFARHIPADPASENSLYSCAIDVLTALHQAPLPAGIGSYSAANMAKLAALSFDFYLAAARGQDMSGRGALITGLEPLLHEVEAGPRTLILRDYHAENLIWLPDRAGATRVGLLDFQDALAGHPAYDLVSLLEDARRDVPEALQAQMLDAYLAQTSTDEDAFRFAYAVLGAQRNLRIVGVFARLCVRDGKPGYIDLIPRVWGHLQRDLSHPRLVELRTLINETLPEPGPDILSTLKDQCATFPKP